MGFGGGIHNSVSQRSYHRPRRLGLHHRTVVRRVGVSHYCRARHHPHRHRRPIWSLGRRRRRNYYYYSPYRSYTDPYYVAEADDDYEIGDMDEWDEEELENWGEENYQALSEGKITPWPGTKYAEEGVEYDYHLPVPKPKMPGLPVKPEHSQAWKQLPLYPSGPMLDCLLVNGRNLHPKDINFSADPYAKFELADSNSNRPPSFEHMTRTYHKTLNPDFNTNMADHKFFPKLGDRDIKVSIQLWDKDTLTSDDWMGQVEFSIETKQTHSDIKILNVQQGNHSGAVSGTVQVKYTVWSEAQLLGIYNARLAPLKADYDASVARWNQECAEIKFAHQMALKEWEEDEKLRKRLLFSQPLKRPQTHDEKVLQGWADDCRKRFNHWKSLPLPEPPKPELPEKYAFQAPAPINNHNTHHMLCVSIIAGRMLAARDDDGLSDPYVVLDIQNSNAPNPETALRAMTWRRFDTLDPVFNCHLYFFVPNDWKSVNIKGECWDYDNGFDDDFMGVFTACVDLKQSFRGSAQWLPLRQAEDNQDPVSGALNVAITACNSFTRSAYTPQQKASGHAAFVKALEYDHAQRMAELDELLKHEQAEYRIMYANFQKESKAQAAFLSQNKDWKPTSQQYALDEGVYRMVKDDGSRLTGITDSGPQWSFDSKNTDFLFKATDVILGRYTVTNTHTKRQIFQPTCCIKMSGQRHSISWTQNGKVSELVVTMVFKMSEDDFMANVPKISCPFCTAWQSSFDTKCSICSTVLKPGVAPAAPPPPAVAAAPTVVAPDVGNVTTLAQAQQELKRAVASQDYLRAAALHQQIQKLEALDAQKVACPVCTFQQAPGDKCSMCNSSLSPKVTAKPLDQVLTPEDVADYVEVTYGKKLRDIVESHSVSKDTLVVMTPEIWKSFGVSDGKELGQLMALGQQVKALSPVAPPAYAPDIKITAVPGKFNQNQPGPPAMDQFLFHPDPDPDLPKPAE